MRPKEENKKPSVEFDEKAAAFDHSLRSNCGQDSRPFIEGARWQFNQDKAKLEALLEIVKLQRDFLDKAGTFGADKALQKSSEILKAAGVEL